MEDFQERVKGELFDLTILIYSLNEFLDSELYESLDYAEKARLIDQFKVMLRYSGILKDRIDNFS